MLIFYCFYNVKYDFDTPPLGDRRGTDGKPEPQTTPLPRGTDGGPTFLAAALDVPWGSLWTL